jgi:hypothetical protein
MVFITPVKQAPARIVSLPAPAALYIKAYLQNSKRHVKHLSGLRHGLHMLFAPEAATVFFGSARANGKYRFTVPLDGMA